MGILKSWTRMTSFIGKEITEVVRRPGALLSLVLGPFLIMALFGAGYSGQRRPLETVLVIPANASSLPRESSFYQEYAGPAVHVLAVSENVDAAREQLRRQDIDLLVVVPSDLDEQFFNGRQASIAIEYNQVDPLRDNYAKFIAYRQVQELNRAIIEQVVGTGKRYAIQSAGADPTSSIPPEVIAAPTRAEVVNWAPTTPTVLHFFAPAVLALVLQHMGVTLTALSMVRERLSGAIDLFRVAPLRTLEILTGKYLAYGFLNLAIATLISFLLIGVLGVPLLGSPRQLAGIVFLLTFASLGMGLLISTVVDSERQAVQLSMLILLASVFFSGFVLPLDEFLPVARYVAYALPVTHGIRLLQDTMLRGGTYALGALVTLGSIGAILFICTAVTLKRNLSSAS